MARHGCLVPLRVGLATAALLLVSLPVAARAEDNSAAWEHSLRKQVDALEAWVDHSSERIRHRLGEDYDRSRAALLNFRQRMESEEERWRVTLSQQQEKLSTFGAEAVKALDRYRTAIDSSWAKMHEQAADALTRITTWLRGHPQQQQDEQVHV